MPTVSSSTSAPNISFSAAHSTDNRHVPRFKGQQSCVRRTWNSRVKEKIQTLYALVRGESNKSGIRKAEELRKRISCRADRMRTAIRNSHDTHSARKAIRSDMEKLQCDEQKLQRLTHGAARLDTVLAEQSTNRYLQNTTHKEDKQRGKRLDKLENSPLNKLRSESAALQHIWDTLQREKVLEAAKDRIPALYGLYSSYTGKDGLPEMSIDILKGLFSLSDSLQAVSPHDGDAANFFYPALKLTYERNRNAPDGGNDRALLNMLRDLANRNPDKGIRAQLGGQSRIGAIDFYLQGKLSIPFSPEDHRAQRGNLVKDLNTLLNGIADAGRQIQRDELVAQTSKWAHAVQPDLVQETEVLYASAQKWRDQDGVDPILQMAPAAAVGQLVDEAIDQVLNNTADDNHGPLLKNLKTHLSRAAIDIEHALNGRHVQDYMTSGQIADLRRDLLEAVVTATGIRSKISQLAQIEQSIDPRSAIKPKSASTHNEIFEPIPQAFQAVKISRDAARIAKRQEEIVNRRTENLKREVTNVLVACLNDAQTIPAKKMARFIEAYNTLKPSKETWFKLLDEVTAAPHMSKKLLTLNTGVLRQHMLGQLNLLGEIEDNSIVNQEADRLLRDVWSSVKASTVQQEATPSLRGLCAVLASPQSMNDEAKKALFSRINELRGWIAGLNVQVNNATLMDAVVRPLSNEELGTLLAALATPRREIETRRQTTTDARPTYQPRTKIGRLLAEDLAGNHQDLTEKTDRFLFELNQIALRQLNVRLDALENSLIPGFNKSFLAEAGRVYQMLNTPKACHVNGASAAHELERLIRESIPPESLDRAEGGLESKRPAEMRPARFVRTAYGYATAAHIARKLRAEISELQKQLQTGQDPLQMANYQSHRVAQMWQNDAVKRILNKSAIHPVLNNLMHGRPEPIPAQSFASTLVNRPNQYAQYARINEYDPIADGYETPGHDGIAAQQSPLHGPNLTRPNSASTLTAESPMEGRRVRSWSSRTTVHPDSVYSDDSHSAPPTPLSSGSSRASAEDMSSLMNYDIPGDDGVAETPSALYDKVPEETSGDSATKLIPTRTAPPPPMPTKTKVENLYDPADDSGISDIDEEVASLDEQPPYRQSAPVDVGQKTPAGFSGPAAKQEAEEDLSAQLKAALLKRRQAKVGNYA